MEGLIRSVFGITYIFSASTVTLLLFDWLLCRRYLPIIHSTERTTNRGVTSGSVPNSLETPLVSSIREESEMTSLSTSNVQEIIHIQHRYTTSRQSSLTPMTRYNKSESPLVYSQILPSNRSSRTSTNVPTPAPSSYRIVTYLGDSSSIHQSCVSIWCLDLSLAVALMLYLFGVELTVSGHWNTDLVERHFEKWTLALLMYTAIWRYIMTRIGRMYDALRMFWSNDHRSEYESHSLNSGGNTAAGAATEYFISMELVLFTFVMSGYFVMYRVYLVYYEPNWYIFCVSLLFHVGSELLENGLKTSVFYYNLTANLYALLSRKHGNDLCIGNVVALMRDDSSLTFWRDRFAIDISIKMAVSMLSCIAAILWYITEFMGYLNRNESAFTLRQLQMAALRVGITAAAELGLYVAMYFTWYKGKGFLFEPFTRIIAGISGKERFVWLFMAAFMTAATGVTFGGQNP